MNGANAHTLSKRDRGDSTRVRRRCGSSMPCVGGLSPQRIGSVLLPHVPLHVVRVERARSVRADVGHGNQLVAAQEVLPQVGPSVDRRVEVGVGVARLLARVARAQLGRRTRSARVRLRPLRTRRRVARRAPPAIRQSARPIEIGGAARHQEVGEIRQAIFDRAEVRAVSSALPDVERRLSESALLRVGLAQIGDVVDPALLGARADVEVHALDGFERADAVFAALQDVVDPLGMLRRAPSTCRPAPVRTSTRAGSAPGLQRPAGRHFVTCSSNVGRRSRLMSGFIVPGLLIWSLGTADVSTVPGRACAKICHSRLLSATCPTP